MKRGFSHRFWVPVPQWCMDLQRQLAEERLRQSGWGYSWGSGARRVWGSAP